MQQGIRKTFFIQAVLILLPVTLLAAYAVVSLQREKQALEDEVRERVSLALSSLAKDLPRQLTKNIRDYVAADRVYTRRLNRSVGPFVDNGIIRLPVPDPEQIAAEDLDLKRWFLANEGFQFRQHPAARWLFPLDTPVDDSWKTGVPRVPGWFINLPEDRLEQWQKIERAIAMGDRENSVRLINDLIVGAGDGEVEANRRYLSRSLESDSFESWLEAAWSKAKTTTPAGLNLSSLSLLHALRLHENEPYDDTTWFVLADYFFRPPNLLTSRVMARIEKHVQNDDPNGLEQLHALEILRDRRYRLAGILDQIEFGNTNAPPPVSWILLDKTEYLVTTDDVGVGGSTKTASGRIVPADWLIQKLNHFSETTRALIPTYMDVELEIAGRRIDLLRRGKWSPHSAMFADVKMVFDGMPSRVGPVGGLSAYLTQPELMYEQFRRRALMMGGLIGLAVLAAVFGLWQSIANLRRQLALNEMKTNFVSSVSHELRAPIASVRLMAENLETGKVRGEAKLGEYVRFIGQECRRLSSLIENVLDFSRIEQSRKTYEFEPTDLKKLVEETVRLMQPCAEERDVKLTVTMEDRHSDRPVELKTAANRTATRDQGELSPADTIELNLDGRAIQQALINLIDNAIKHSPAGESIEVRLERRTSFLSVILSVTDHGPGIPTEDHEKIFEQFFRRGSELRRETQGIGIGLSIVKHIIEGHGGRVWVESQSDDGSRFIIELNESVDQRK